MVVQQFQFHYIKAWLDDTEPLPVYSNIALFARGSSRAMFENVYALCNNYSQNTSFSLGTPVNSVFGDSDIDASESFRKYALSGLVQSTYLSGVGSSESPKYNIYFEEFGTIMREVAEFNFKYDKAFPALTAKISPTFNKIKGFTVSGFRAGSYGAEFLIFNATDTALSLDETSGNYLRIQGITFTQQSSPASPYSPSGALDIMWSPGLGKWIASIFTSQGGMSGNSTKQIMTSLDGITWTIQNLPVFATVSGVPYSPNLKALATVV